MTIRTITALELSTAHLTPDTASRLDNEPPHAWPVSGGATAYGFFIYAHDQNDGLIPEDLWLCCETARQQGCSYLLFDRDADVLPGLPVHDW